MYKGIVCNIHIHLALLQGAGASHVLLLKVLRQYICPPGSPTGFQRLGGMKIDAQLLRNGCGVQ